MSRIALPKDVENIIKYLNDAGYEAYAVGGCIRDSLLGREPKDWDITTDALPEAIIELFQSEGFKVIGTGLKHGTVTVIIRGIGYEITTFRIDGEYSDNRRPDNVVFTGSLKEDLSRRDFTINAMAYNDKVGLIDYYNGKLDLENRIIRSVGNPDNRFNEDALRMLRAVRFSAQLQFSLEAETLVPSIIKNSALIQNISKERIREELCKILLSNKPSFGIIKLSETGLLNYILPELIPCIGFNQNNIHHDKDVFQHILSAVENTPLKLDLRLAALFHDIGKPQTYSIDEKRQGHFYDHQKKVRR